MNSAAQSSNPPPPAAAGDGGGGASSLLAPGFRFHPTDEELVSYYLRRKVLGRSLRVDAISEVDLYKIEPWDLPELSRIRSRDLEWYFFSPLDRKYSNRSRTNRATVQGYWKTTGKDRAINHGSRVVGMKKTLVFHVGRAPKGKRTNWVMHEYRLEDEKLAQTGIQQDGYVVCRIFQKNGVGPQNGAQYGAPFVEEEWDDEEANGLAMVPLGIENEVNGAEDNEYLQFDEFVQSQEMGNRDQGASDAQFVGSNVYVGSSDAAHYAVLNDEQHEDPKFLNEMVEYVNEPGRENNFPIGIEETKNSLGIENGRQSPPSRPDEYLELNDLLNIPSEESDNYPLRSSCTQRWADGEDSSSHRLFGNDKFLSNRNENSEQFELLQMLPFEDSLDLQRNGLPNAYTHAPWNEGEDDTVFYDVPAEFSFMQDSLFQLNEQNPPISGPSSLDTIDDFMAYFDATNEMLPYGNNSPLENTEYIVDQFKIGNKVDDSSSKKEVLFANVDGASSSVSHQQPDVPSNKNTKRTSTKHLVNMLGSIAAPSAYASESPPKIGKFVKNISATSSPIHVTAGLIELHGLAVAGIGDNWSLKKNAKVDFLLSCSVGDTLGKSVYAEPNRKVYGGAISVVLRGGLNFFFLSALILAISGKVGMSIYSW